MARCTRVLVADSHPLVCEGAARVITACPDMELVGQVGDGPAAIAQVLQQRPDVALIELRLAEADGLAVLTVSHAAVPSTRVVFVGERFEWRLVVQAVSAGVAGFLTTRTTPRELEIAIAAAALGEPVLSSDVQRQLLKYVRVADGSAAAHLSKREHEILGLVASGKTAAQIAHHLYVEATTIRTHLHRMHRKLGVTNSASAVAEAMRRGLLE